MKAAFEIGHTLTILSPELTRNYENKNFKGCKSLAELSDKYYHYTLSEKRVEKKLKISLILMFFSMIVGLPLSFMYSKQYLMIPIMTITLLLSFLVLYAFGESSDRKKFAKNLLPAVKQFCEAAESLNASRYWSRNILNKETVEAELVKMARDVLTEQDRFDILSPQGHSYVREILEHGHKILENEERVNLALKNSEKFGLHFDKTHIYNRAHDSLIKLNLK